MTDQVTVTQEDRDEATTFYSGAWDAFWPDNFSTAMQTCDEMRRGHCDNWALIQAFARHRIAAEQRGMERAAVIAESHMKQCLDDKDVQKRWPEIKARNDVYATLIRQAAKDQA